MTRLARIASRWASLRARARQRFAALPPERQRQLRLLAASPLVALVALLLWRSRYPTLRVVNSTADPLLLIIDEKQRILLPPVSAETPEAGVVLRLSPGSHKLEALHEDGSSFDRLDVALPAASMYLMAPGMTDQCFWIQHTAYGQAKPTMPPLRLLPREQRIWAVPDEIDAWFFPTPAPSSLDRRSSGGTRTAIRQARCGFEPWR